MTHLLELSPTALIIDREPEIRISGLEPGTIFEVTSSLTDRLGVEWRASARYQARTAAPVLLSEEAPLDGSFVSPGVSGFFYSMTPDAPEGPTAFKEAGPPPAEPGAKRGHRLGLPEISDASDLAVRFDLRVRRAVLAREPLQRSFGLEEVEVTEVASGNVRGRLFEPRGNGPCPAVVLLSGSGGGIYPQDASVLASHGFSVLALAYFNYADLPSHQKRVPLEYFEKAFRWYRTHLGHDRIGVTGPSKGGEASLILAAHLRDYVKACAPIVPGDLYLCAADEQHRLNPAWTYRDKELPWAGTPADWARVPEELRVPTERKLFNARLNLEPFYAASDVYERSAIPVEDIECPLLLIWGEDDQAWPSKLAVRRIIDRLAASNRSFDLESVVAPDAGHFFTFPGLPTSLSDSILHPLLPIHMTMGGTPAGTATLQRKGWDAMISFFRRTLSGG